MANASVAIQTRPLFPYAKWFPQASSLSRQFRENKPYPHLHFKEFLDPGIAEEMAAEFPGLETDAWTRYKHQNENKLGLTKRELFPPLLSQVVGELNSREFVAWLSQVTGIPGLLADDSLEGGAAPVRARRLPEYSHRLLHASLPKALAAAGEPHSLSQP